MFTLDDKMDAEKYPSTLVKEMDGHGRKRKHKHNIEFCALYHIVNVRNPY